MVKAGCRFRRNFVMLSLLLAWVAQCRGQPVDSSQQGDASVIFRHGVEAMQARQFDVAEKDFRKVIALDPKSAAPHINLGVTFMRQKRWEDALAELRRAEALAPDQPGTLLNMGLAYYRENDFAAAIDPFQASLKLAPQSLQARYLLGLCYFFRHRYSEAAETLAPLWNQESSNPNYLYVLSIAANKSHHDALDQQAVQRLVSVGQSSPEFHLYLGKAYLAKGDRDRAIKEFQVAETARPDMPVLHYLLGRTYLEQHSYREAEREFRKDISIEPEFPYSYEDLGLLYAALDQPQQAEQAFRQSIEREKTLVNSYVGLAKLDRAAGRNDQALAMLDQAVHYAPHSASVHYLRGQVLARLGKTAQAQQEFKVSAELLKTVNDQLQQGLSGDEAEDAQDAAQQ